MRSKIEGTYYLYLQVNDTKMTTKNNKHLRTKHNRESPRFIDGLRIERVDQKTNKTKYTSQQVETIE